MRISNCQTEQMEGEIRIDVSDKLLLACKEELKVQNMTKVANSCNYGTSDSCQSDEPHDFATCKIAQDEENHRVSAESPSSNSTSHSNCLAKMSKAAMIWSDVDYANTYGELGMTGGHTVEMFTLPPEDFFLTKCDSLDDIVCDMNDRVFLEGDENEQDHSIAIVASNSSETIEAVKLLKTLDYKILKEEMILSKTYESNESYSRNDSRGINATARNRSDKVIPSFTHNGNEYASMQNGNIYYQDTFDNHDLCMSSSSSFDVDHLNSSSSRSIISRTLSYVHCSCQE